MFFHISNKMAWLALGKNNTLHVQLGRVFIYPQIKTSINYYKPICVNLQLIRACES